ncbi:hypothetical protein SPLC1_S203070 [Arthrospira platensis C1]|nr:hypothetical protein SPLC1_S203070 [Arthrospira platensis C1]
MRSFSHFTPKLSQKPSFLPFNPPDNSQKKSMKLSAI